MTLTMERLKALVEGEDFKYYLDPALDITGSIIERYDAAKKAGTLPKPPPSADGPK